MAKGLTYLEFSNIIEQVSHQMKGSKDFLNELDSATGDGDLGITINHGFNAVEETIKSNPENPSHLLIKAGMAFNNAAGSSMGALFGMALMRAGKEIRGIEIIDLKAFVLIVKGMEDSIREKGKADVGNKTMLDALVPARISLENSISKNMSEENGLKLAYEAAAEGAEKTKLMQATYGRSRWLGERTIGFSDPGAVFISLFFKSIWECYKARVDPTLNKY